VSGAATRAREQPTMATLDIQAVLANLPHRYPMLLVDRIVECDEEKRIVGIKNVTINEPCFQGHFPGRPVMPGVLQLEAMAQTAGILLNRIVGAEGRLPYFLAIDKARFRRVVRPGDQLRIQVEIIVRKTKVARFRGEIYVEGELASEAEMMCMITEEQVSG
jgi:beta-hydroxyacyl-ACP dehydratase FabZ